MAHANPTLLLMLGLLAAVAMVAALARKVSASYPIFLVITGLLCSLIPHVPRVPLPPDVVLYVLLPPLLYAAAWQTSWREFNWNLVSVTLLAVGLVFFTALGAAVVAPLFLPGFDWRLGFLLGAIVSPTDAVAATSIAKRMGLPHQLLDLLEGESLVNDATGLLALQFGLDMIVHGTAPPLSRAAPEFLWLVAGGIAVGLLTARIVTFLERWVDDGPIETALSVIAAYASYLAGDAAGASGVIAVVACGLYLSRHSDQDSSPQSRLQLVSVWGATEFLLNGVVFLLIGLQLPAVLAGVHGYSFVRLSIYGVAFSALLIALRLAWMYPGARLAYTIRHRLLHQQYRMPKMKELFIVGWTGMRGVVALAAAGSLPYTTQNGQPFPQRGVVVFFTFVVILVTLVVQGLTLPGVVRALGFEKDERSKDEEAEARRRLLQRGIDSVTERQASVADAEKALYGDMLHFLKTRMQELQVAKPKDVRGDAHADTRRDAMLDSLRNQREELNSMRQAGTIGDEVYWKLERELDLNESQLTPATE